MFHRNARLWLTLLVVGLTAAGCFYQEPLADDKAGVVKGFGLSPQGFPLDFSRLAAFYREVATFPGAGVMWNGAWRADVHGGSDAGEIPRVIVSTLCDAGDFGFTPVLVVGWRSEADVHLSVPGDPTDDWTNQTAARLYVTMVAELAARHRPPWLFLGNESEAYFIEHPEDYARWIDVYNRAYDAVKAASPGTRVGPVFNHDRLSGQGALAGWTTPRWGALEAHDLDRVDVLGLTFYPWLGAARPEAVPADLLDPLLARIGEVPIAITETGWPARTLGGLDPKWETSPSAQVRYVDRLSQVLRGADVRMLNWAFLYPLEDAGGQSLVWKLFSSVSLRDFAGEKRPVYEIWKGFHP